MAKKLADVRKKGTLDFLRPDGKTQVSVRYSSDDRALGIDAVVLSTQHSEDVKYKTLKEAVMEEVVKPVLPAKMVLPKTKYFINPTGRFVVGGPQGDCGLTGRKIIVDTYGGVGSHGGGAFSGKDPTKVDRSASYMARHIAKNIVAAGLAEMVELQIAYAIGVPDPVSIMADTMHTGKVEEAKIVEAIRQVFPLTPKGIIDYLDLRKPIFKATAAYGHFGRAEFPWERTDKAEALRKLLLK
jgi:S-adenosylmethionine synthetase